MTDTGLDREGNIDLLVVQTMSCAPVHRSA
jgi:hypothetical protein